MGPGLYILGLDFHAGFVLYDGEQVYSVNSSYISPHAVVKRPVGEDDIIENSEYRVIGKLFDDAMIDKWIKNERFQTHR